MRRARPAYRRQTIPWRTGATWRDRWPDRPGARILKAATAEPRTPATRSSGAAVSRRVVWRSCCAGRHGALFSLYLPNPTRAACSRCRADVLPRRVRGADRAGLGRAARVLGSNRCAPARRAGLAERRPDRPARVAATCRLAVANGLATLVRGWPARPGRAGHDGAVRPRLITHVALLTRHRWYSTVDIGGLTSLRVSCPLPAGSLDNTVCMTRPSPRSCCADGRPSYAAWLSCCAPLPVAGVGRSCSQGMPEPANRLCSPRPSRRPRRNRRSSPSSRRARGRSRLGSATPGCTGCSSARPTAGCRWSRPERSRRPSTVARTRPRNSSVASAFLALSSGGPGSGPAVLCRRRAPARPPPRRRSRSSPGRRRADGHRVRTRGGGRPPAGRRVVGRPSWTTRPARPCRCRTQAADDVVATTTTAAGNPPQALTDPPSRSPLERAAAGAPPPQRLPYWSTPAARLRAAIGRLPTDTRWLLLRSRPTRTSTSAS